MSFPQTTVYYFNTIKKFVKYFFATSSFRSSLLMEDIRPLLWYKPAASLLRSFRCFLHSQLRAFALRCSWRTFVLFYGINQQLRFFEAFAASSIRNFQLSLFVAHGGHSSNIRIWERICASTILSHILMFSSLFIPCLRLGLSLGLSLHSSPHKVLVLLRRNHFYIPLQYSLSYLLCSYLQDSLLPSTYI